MLVVLLRSITCKAPLCSSRRVCKVWFKFFPLLILLCRLTGSALCVARLCVISVIQGFGCFCWNVQLLLSIIIYFMPLPVMLACNHQYTLYLKVACVWLNGPDLQTCEIDQWLSVPFSGKEPGLNLFILVFGQSMRSIFRRTRTEFLVIVRSWFNLFFPWLFKNRKFLKRTAFICYM